MNKTVIIAEAGVNHNGKLELAYRLVDAAAEAGADYVKFQTWNSERVISKYADKAKYQEENSSIKESMLEMVKRLELSFGDFLKLKAYCRMVGIGFLSSPFDIESAEFLFSVGVDMIKIPSGEITNLPLLETVAKHSCPAILSTGMSELREIEAALIILKKEKKKQITLLHCNTQYPTPMEDVNLRVIQTLKEHFGLPAGLSDHSLGAEVPIAAVALGAKVIEKHLTLSCGMEGPDHKASMEPKAFCNMVQSIRNVELALGSERKHVTESERENIVAARKSIVAARKISGGEVFTEVNLAVKRPGTGISPMKWHELIGRAAPRDFEEDELITVE